MREHPIPQDITSYRFHIIGSMTLKQFGEIFLGVVIALIFYKTNLFFPVKWFFIILFAGLGAAAAFVPIEERPLDHWIITFFKIMYKPTQFFWRKVPTIPPAFLYEPLSTTTASQGPELDLTPIRRDRIKQYLQSVRVVSPQTADTIEQTDRIQGILETFKTQPITTPTVIKQVEQKPDLLVRVRKMRTDTIVPTTTPTEITVFSSPIPAGHLKLEQTERETALQNTTHEIDETLPPTQTPATGVVIPDQQPIVVENHVVADAQQIGVIPPVVDPSGRAYVSSGENVPPPDETGVTNAQASFNMDLPFPTTPDVPNKLVGMVLTPNSELVTDAIVEIHALDGNILRAVKTNALGQFFISTPLTDGEYKLVVEKDGLTFEPKQFSLTGTIVPPVEVRSV